MLIFSKIFTVFVLPPGCFILGIVVCLVFYKRKAARTLLAGLTVCLFLLSLGPVKDLLFLPLENCYPPLSKNFTSPGDVDFIVVLGGGSVAGSPEEYGKDSLSSEALKRALYGYRLASSYGLPLIFSGGKVFDQGQETEADAAARALIGLGLDERRVLKETSSRNTWENARRVAEVYRAKRVLLVTSAYHMPRSVWCFEKNGVKVFPAPTDYHVSRGIFFAITDFLPSMHALRDSYVALHEYIGLLSYRLLYG